MTEPRNSLDASDRSPAVGSDGSDSLLGRLGSESPRRRYPQRAVSAGFLFINGFITIGTLGLLAMLSNMPFLFPSLGPSAFLSFFHPASPTSSPRNALCGHALGILCGYGALWVTGLTDAPSAIGAEVTLARVLACALSLAATAATMIVFHVVHPPAGATTLIVSLGIITRPFDLLIIELAVALITLEALIINRLAGVAYPIWAGRVAQSSPVSSESRQ